VRKKKKKRHTNVIHPPSTVFIQLHPPIPLNLLHILSIIHRINIPSFHRISTRRKNAVIRIDIPPSQDEMTTRTTSGTVVEVRIIEKNLLLAALAIERELECEVVAFIDGIFM